MTYSGPAQPMSGNVQENFRMMCEHVRQWNPQYPQPLIERSLNTRLRMVMDRRMWGGLLVRGQIIVEGVYGSGTINCTQGSSTITGTTTTWPVNDKVDTTLSTPITEVGVLQDITPASMTNIGLGDWVLVDTGGSQEILLVVSVTPTTFRAVPVYTHAGGTVITKSSLVRRQLRESTGKGQYYNIKAIIDAATMIIDLPFGSANITGGGYNIKSAYVSMEQDLRMVWSIVNHMNGWRIKFNLPAEALNNYDVWRTATGFTTKMVDYVPDEVGRFRYELYPAPASAQSFPYLAYRTIPSLVDDEDTPPPGIPSHMLVHGAIADALRWARRDSDYYDPQTAMTYEHLFESDLTNAALADDSIYMTNLKWAFDAYEMKFGADWHQAHDVDSTMGWI